MGFVASGRCSIAIRSVGADRPGPGDASGYNPCMYEQLPAGQRERHPFHMYDEIREGPDAVERSIALVGENGAPVAAALARARRVFVLGSGTSLHAAEVGAWMLRTFSRGKIDARALQSFEFTTYELGLRPDDVPVVVSHSGGTHAALRALERVRRSGMESVTVTGFPNGETARLATHVLPTGFPREMSWAHTASYLAAIASFAALANDLADPAERLELGQLPEAVRDALGLEDIAHRAAAGVVLAERENGTAHIFFTGGGPNAATAREAQLKVLETSYLHANAFELEQALHGPLAGLERSSLLVLIAPPGASSDRAAGLARAALRIGSVPLALVGEENAGAFEDCHRVLLPTGVPEVLSPVTSVVPLQLFSYFLAVGRGLNPDLIRRDDEPYREARTQYE